MKKTTIVYWILKCSANNFFPDICSYKFVNLCSSVILIEDVVMYYHELYKKIVYIYSIMPIVILGETLKIVDQNNIVLLKGLNLSETTSITFNTGSKIIMNNNSIANLPTGSKVSIGNTSTTLNMLLNSQIPKGCIIIWSGTEAQIPSGWSPCHGGIINGVEIPDLRNLFIIGESPTNSVGVIGGNINNSLLIQNANLPSHSHTGTLAQVNANHGHTSDIFAGGTSGTSRPRLAFRNDGGNVSTGGNKQNHTHTITFSSVGGTTPVDIRPPYYSLIYIIATGS